MWAPELFHHLPTPFHLRVDINSYILKKYYRGASIRYKKGPAIRYKKGPSIRYIGSKCEIFLKGAFYKVHWSISKKLRYIGQKWLYLITVLPVHV